MTFVVSRARKTHRFSIMVMLIVDGDDGDGDVKDDKNNIGAYPL